MSDIQRKLVTVRKVDRVDPIPGADAIEVATVEGWQVVIKKGEFVPGSYCVYFEIDSFLPDGHPAWQFLVDKQGREFEGVRGHRLRTVKLRGQISQGFIAKIDMFPQIVEFALMRKCDGHFCEDDYAEFRSEDFAPLLGIKKWEQPLPAELAGQAEGLFPSFIRRTDQERCQNLIGEIFQTEDRLLDFSLMAQTMTPEALTALSDKGIITWGGDRWMKVDRAKADPNARYEVTIKLDGSSCTVFARPKFNQPVDAGDGTFENPIESGVCSRNLQLKVNEENAGNTFISVAVKSGLLSALEKLARDGEGSFAVQGELMGPGIQGNRENLKVHQLFVFDVQNLDTQTYLTPEQRADFMTRLYNLEDGGLVDGNLVKHTPVLHAAVTLAELGITDVKQLLAFAEGPSLVHPVREGLVFKRVDGTFSFKAISNKYLAGEKD